MEIVALLAGILTAIVFVAERLAFAVMMYLMCRWVFRTSQPLFKLMNRWADQAWAGLKVVHQSILHYWAMKALRGQMMRGATP